ncbi:MAG: hypothetical protein ACQ5SW_09590 [Sphaerochaetaceae bacterium]
MIRARFDSYDMDWDDVDEVVYSGRFPKAEWMNELGLPVPERTA